MAPQPFTTVIGLPGQVRDYSFSARLCRCLIRTMLFYAAAPADFGVPRQM
jgi:hypothetical protein